MSEQKLQSKIIKFLESKGFWVVKTILCNKKGIPDILSLSPNGVFLAIEVKYGNNKPSKLQNYQLTRIEENKGVAMLAYSLSSVETVVDRILN